MSKWWTVWSSTRRLSRFVRTNFSYFQATVQRAHKKLMPSKDILTSPFFLWRVIISVLNSGLNFWQTNPQGSCIVMVSCNSFLWGVSPLPCYRTINTTLLELAVWTWSPNRGSFLECTDVFLEVTLTSPILLGSRTALVHTFLAQCYFYMK